MLKKAPMIHMLFIFVCGLLLSPHSVADRGIVTYYHNDLLGSPQFASDQYGDIKWKEDYKPYGEKLVKSVAAKDNRVGYTGASHDNDTGLTYLGARYYDPNIGRFMAMDPVGFNINNTASVNRYAYANNNPYRYVDPKGESPIDVIFLGADLVKLGVALHSGNPLAIQSSILDVGASLVGVVSPIPGTGQLIKTGIVGKKVLNAAEAVQQAAKSAAVLKKTAKAKGGAKRGPKTDPNAPHNKKIRELGDQIEKEHGVGSILAGGGRLPEKLIPTPGGYKNGRRPDILYKDSCGNICGVNVGKSKANGQPIKREAEAKKDLEGAGISMKYERYDK